MNPDPYILDPSVAQFYEEVIRLDGDDLVDGALRLIFSEALDAMPGPADIQALLNQIHATLARLDEAWNDHAPLPNEPWWEGLE